jgi:hypothetical protein
MTGLAQFLNRREPVSFLLQVIKSSGHHRLVHRKLTGEIDLQQDSRPGPIPVSSNCCSTFPS